MIAMIFDDGCDVGGFGKGLLFVWICGGCAAPPRASPCVLASLVRVPLTLKRRGTGVFTLTPVSEYGAGSSPLPSRERGLLVAQE